MEKKRYFILSPVSGSERTTELKTKALAYYGSKDYDLSTNTEDVRELCSKNLKELVNADANASMLLIGLTLMAMSKCDSVYIADGWDQDDVCKFCHMVAFSHGLELVYEE